MASKGPKSVPTTGQVKPVAKSVTAPAQPAAAKAPVTPAAPAAKKIEQPVAAAVAAPKAAPAAIVETPAEIVQPIAVEAVKAAQPVVEKIAATAAALAPVVNKEVTNMETTINNAADKAQTYFADAQDRAKGTWEKTQKLAEDMNTFGKGNVEALVESGKIAAKGFETIGQDAADYSRRQFESATATLKNFSSVKSPTELFKLHSDYVRASFDSIVAETSKNTEAMLKLAGEIAQPIQNRVAVAVDRLKVAA